MYAVYQSGFEKDYKNNAAFYEGLAEKMGQVRIVYISKSFNPDCHRLNLMTILSYIS